MPADGIFDKTKTIVGTDVKVWYDLALSRYEIDDPAGTGTAKIAPGDSRVAHFKDVCIQAQALAGVAGVGNFSITCIDATGAAFLTLRFESAASRFKVETGSTEFAYVPYDASKPLELLGTAIDQIAADKAAEGL